MFFLFLKTIFRFTNSNGQCVSNNNNNNGCSFGQVSRVKIWVSAVLRLTKKAFDQKGIEDFQLFEFDQDKIDKWCENIEEGIWGICWCCCIGWNKRDI